MVLKKYHNTRTQRGGSMSTYEMKKIGRIQSSLEDGSLKLYCHELGHSTGFSSKLSAEETLGLLDLLSRHRDDIYQAVNEHERHRARQEAVHTH
jgi:ABC-type transport system involved in cytochrome c biogenesis ATPase subunit